MKFTIDDIHLIKWVHVSEKGVFDRRWSLEWWGKDTGQNISARSLTLLFFCSGVGIVWSTTTRTRVSDANAVTVSIRCFNPLKLYPLLGNIFRKWFASYFFIYSRAFNKILISYSKYDCCNDVRFTSLIAKKRMFKKNTNYFMLLESPFHWLFCLKF